MRTIITIAALALVAAGCGITTYRLEPNSVVVYANPGGLAPKAVDDPATPDVDESKLPPEIVETDGSYVKAGPGGNAARVHVQIGGDNSQTPTTRTSASVGAGVGVGGGTGEGGGGTVAGDPTDEEPDSE